MKKSVRCLVLLLLLAAAGALLAALPQRLEQWVCRKQDDRMQYELANKAAVLEDQLKSMNTLLTLHYQSVRASGITDADETLKNADRYRIYKAKCAMEKINASIVSRNDWPVKELMLYFTRSRIALTEATMYTLDNLASLCLGIPEAALTDMLDGFQHGGSLYGLEKLDNHFVYLRKFSMVGTEDKIIGICLLDPENFRYLDQEDGLMCIVGRGWAVGFFQTDEALPDWDSLGGSSEDAFWPFEGQRYRLRWREIMLDGHSDVFRLVFMMPEAAYLRGGAMARRGCAAALLLGMAAAMVFCIVRWRNRDRMRLLLCELPDGAPQGGSAQFQQLYTGIVRLVHQNKDWMEKYQSASEQIEQHESLMRRSFIRMLILGEVKDGRLRDLLNLYGLPEEAMNCRVILVHAREQAIAPNRLREMHEFAGIALDSLMPCLHEMCSVDDFTAGVLCMGGPEENNLGKPALRKVMESLTSLIRQRLGIEVSAAIGQCVSGLEHCPVSYYSARMVLICGTQDGMQNLSATASGSLESEPQMVQILQLLSQGKIQQCLAQYDRVFRLNENEPEYNERQRNSAMVFFSLFDDYVGSHGTLKKRLASSGVVQQQLRRCMTFEDILRLIRSMLETACRILEEEDSGNRAALMVDQAISILKHRFSDPNLSQTSIADELGVNSSLLSTQFKEMTNVNMSMYLRLLRLNRVKELLLDTDMPLKDIAEQSGFASLKTMYRVFKAETNMTPTQFRSEHLLPS